MASFDPFLAISGQRKAWNMEEFLATAQPHMDQLFSTTSSLGLPKSCNRALEFGCGAGRFLPHLKKRFGEVWGVDVSMSMIDLAKKYNPGCRFHLNVTTDLGFFPEGHFDLIYSFLVLQHLPDKFMILQYVKEFMRVLAPGGLAVFQIPDHLKLRWKFQPRRRLYRVLYALGFSSKRLQSWALLPMSLTALPEEMVRDAVSVGGGEVCRKERLGWTEGVMYYCTK